MKPTVKKLRHIFLPFIVTSILFIVTYTFLNWLIFIKADLFSVKEDIIKFWVPFALPWIPILIWLRPKIKLLKLTGANGNLPFLYQIVAAMAIAAPTIVAQEYIVKASGTLTRLESIYEIEKSEPSKYYSLNQYYFDKSNIGVYHSVDVSGKNNEYFNMHIYVVMPIFKRAADTINMDCYAWLGFEYSDQISNNANDENKEQMYQSFVLESQYDFDKKDFTEFVYLDRVGNTDDGDGYKEAIKTSSKYNPKHTSVFLQVNEPFENRAKNSFAWIFGALGIGTIIWLIMILIPDFNESDLKKFESGKPIKDKDLKEFLDFIKPREGYFITPIIIYLNILIFIIMMFAGLGFISFKAPDLLNWGANYKPLTTSGEWWRLLSCTFLHGGIMHLVANMYGLIFVGIFLEPVLGKVKFLLVYLLSGIFASCVSLYWHDAVVSVGASGAIFGLYGLFLALLLTKIFPPEFSKSFLASTIIFIGYNLIVGLTGNIDNAAHIGGLISGIILALFIYPGLKKID